MKVRIGREKEINNDEKAKETIRGWLQRFSQDVSTILIKYGGA